MVTKTFCERKNCKREINTLTTSKGRFSTYRWCPSRESFSCNVGMEDIKHNIHQDICHRCYGAFKGKIIEWKTADELKP